jgi:NADP-dependent 3-hydroxy acid dehydrogenase YdfG
MDINFWGTVYCSKFALPHLLKSKGSIAGISSIAGYKGLPCRTGYSASKFAMQGFLESLCVSNYCINRCKCTMDEPRLCGFKYQKYRIECRLGNRPKRVTPT